MHFLASHGGHGGADVSEIVYVLLLILGLAAIAGGVYRAWVRDFLGAAVLLVVGLVVLVVAT